MSVNISIAEKHCEGIACIRQEILRNYTINILCFFQTETIDKVVDTEVFVCVRSVPVKDKSLC